MDAASLSGGDYASANHQRGVPFLRNTAAPLARDAELCVMILYADPVIAAGLASVLHEHTGFQVVSAPKSGDPFDLNPPADVVVADYETAMNLAETAPQWAKNLLIFTNCDSESRIGRALEIGARGYLLCGVGLPELFDGIRAVRAGGVALSPLVAAQIANRIKRATLTARERAVLEQLMLGLSNKVIASKLNVRLGTVKSHIKSILSKLGARSRTAAAITAQRRGLLP